MCTKYEYILKLPSLYYTIFTYTLNLIHTCIHTHTYMSTQFRALLTKHEWEKDPELVAAICQAGEKLVDVHRKYLKVMTY